MCFIQLWDRREEYHFLDFTVIIAVVLIGGLVGGLKNRDTSGCGLTSAWTFDANGHYNATMGNRSFLVHVPPSYTSNTQYPVVLSFHGYGKNDTWQEHITGLSEPSVQINNQVRFHDRISPSYSISTTSLGYHCSLSSGRLGSWKTF